MTSKSPVVVGSSLRFGNPAECDPSLHRLTPPFFLSPRPLPLCPSPFSRLSRPVDGAEDDIRQVFYVFALQREWNEEEAALKWRLLEFQEVASFGYL